MNELIQKMLQIEKFLVRKKGYFKLFALFLREGSPGKWDVLVSAKWIDANKQQALKVITEQFFLFGYKTGIFNVIISRFFYSCKSCKSCKS